MINIQESAEFNFIQISLKSQLVLKGDFSCPNSCPFFILVSNLKALMH